MIYIITKEIDAKLKLVENNELLKFGKLFFDITELVKYRGDASTKMQIKMELLEDDTEAVTEINLLTENGVENIFIGNDEECWIDNKPFWDELWNKIHSKKEK